LAEKGDANAQFLFGQYLEHVEPYVEGKPRTHDEYQKWSDRLRKNREEARKWYDLAARQGHVAGSYALAKAYGSASPLERRRLYLYAAEKGHVEAMDALSESYRYTYKASEYRLDRDYPQDFGQVVLWKTRAAERGHPQAKEDLAIWYWKGLMGLRADYQKTRELLLDAAKLGLCSAMLNVGGLYFNGDGVPQNASEAQKWFAKSKECDGNNAALRKHADKYVQQARAGDLPKAQPEGGAAARSNPQGSWQQEAFEKGFWRGVGLGAVILLMTQGAKSGPSDALSHDPSRPCEYNEVPYPHSTGVLGRGYSVIGNSGLPCTFW
jgi:TPR repeat protein